MQGELMDAVQGLKEIHYERHALTDISLALMQDTGWCVTFWFLFSTFWHPTLIVPHSGQPRDCSWVGWGGGAPRTLQRTPPPPTPVGNAPLGLVAA